MMYTVRVSDDLKYKFADACKILGFKQSAIIEGYMEEIIKRAEQVKALKDIDFISVKMPIFNKFLNENDSLFVKMDKEENVSIDVISSWFYGSSILLILRELLYKAKRLINPVHDGVWATLSMRKHIKRNLKEKKKI